MIPYSLRILWRDRGRFIPATLAVSFSAVLIAMQCGMLFGILLCSSVPVDHAGADIWLTTRDTTALGETQPIPRAWLLRLAQQPEIERVEPCLIAWAIWHRPGRSNAEICVLVGSRLDEKSPGVMKQIPPEVRARLAEPRTVVVDRGDLNTLGLDRSTDQTGEVNGQRVRVLSAVPRCPGFNYAWFFCSLETARQLIPRFEEQPELIVFGVARCRQPGDAPAVIRRLRALYPEMGVYTPAEFSRRIQWYWLFRSRAGAIMVCTVTLALLVGLVITSQTLYGAVRASLREYAMLDALGTPRWRLAGLVLAQSFWVGLAGVVLAIPLSFALRWAALLIRAEVLLGGELLAATGALTVLMAVVSGVVALRSLGRIEPATLLR